MEYKIEKINLDRDYLEIEKLLIQEEWPFLRGDLQASHQQPKSVGRIARDESGHCVGFFMTHHFGDIGYLDMMVVEKTCQDSGVARPLFMETMDALEAKGMKSYVVHTTQESAPMIQFLEFSAGQSFTLLRRERGEEAIEKPSLGDVIPLSTQDLSSLLELDERIFGLKRPEWISSLLTQPEVRFFGLRRAGHLVASLCLRPRRAGAFCLDMANAEQFEDLEYLLAHLIPNFSEYRLECFARSGSELHRSLEAQGFCVPEFFKAIGPLTEWRKGPTGEVGLSTKVQCLSWF